MAKFWWSGDGPRVVRRRAAAQSLKKTTYGYRRAQPRRATRRADEWKTLWKRPWLPSVYYSCCYEEAVRLAPLWTRKRGAGAGACCWYGMLSESVAVVGRSGVTASGVVMLFHRVAAGSDEL